MGAPKLRFFAGPNGSGKSTIKDQIPAGLINVYINADDLEKAAHATGFINLTEFNISPSLQKLTTGFYPAPTPPTLSATTQEGDVLIDPALHGTKRFRADHPRIALLSQYGELAGYRAYTLNQLFGSRL